MKEFIVIPLLNEYDEILEQLDLSDISESTSIYSIGINLITNLLKETLPSKNQNIALKNVLDFLREQDGKINQYGTTLLPINSSTFISYFGSFNYKKFIDLFDRLKVMTAVPYTDGTFYLIDEKPKLWRFHNEYVKDEPAIFILKNDCYGSLRIEGSFDKKMVNTIRLIEVDYKNAILAELDYYNKNSLFEKNIGELKFRLSKLFSLSGERFINKGQKSDRIYHSLSNLSRISRRFLTIKGKSFYNLDIKNCQPLLLVWLIKESGLEVDDNYIKDCEEGILYERFYTQTGNKEIDKERRDNTKIYLYKTIYFDFKPNSIAGNGVGDTFESLYPKTFQSLKMLSMSGKTLASQLQNIESSVFNNLKPKSNYYFTLFDAIYFTDFLDKENLTLQIEEKFRKWKLKPQVKFGSNDEEEWRE